MQSPFLSTQIEHDRKLWEAFTRRPINDPARFIEDALCELQRRLRMTETLAVGFSQAALSHLMDKGRITPAPEMTRADWVGITDLLGLKGNRVLADGGRTFSGLWKRLVLDLRNAPLTLSLPVANNHRGQQRPAPDICLISYPMSLDFHWVRLELQRLQWPPPEAPHLN